MAKNPLDGLTLPPGARPPERPVCPKCKTEYQVGQLLVYCIVRLSERDMDMMFVHMECPELERPEPECTCVCHGDDDWDGGTMNCEHCSGYDAVDQSDGP